MGYPKPKTDVVKRRDRKFVRYAEGAEQYSIGKTNFIALAREAKAVYKIDHTVLVSCAMFEKFLEGFRE